MTLSDFEYVTTTTNNPIWYKDTNCRHPLICPKGTKIKFLDIFINFPIGEWYKVEYNGETYYIDPKYCDGNVIVKKEIKSYFDIATLSTITLILLTDRYGKQYVLNEKNEMLPVD